MFCRSITWVICTFVAVAIANGNSGRDSNTESSRSEAVQEVRPNIALDVGAESSNLHSNSVRQSSSGPGVSGSSPYPATQLHISLSGHQTPTTAAPIRVAQTTAYPNDDDIAFLRSLSAEEKGERLIEAAMHGAVDRVEALLAVGANVGARDVLRRTPLHWAAVGGHEEAARRLLAAGAEVDARNRWQRTPLHHSAHGGHAALVRLLLAAKADHSARDRDETTPLHWAANRGHREAAAALLEAGADRGARDNKGRTPLDHARENNHQQLVELLQEDSGVAGSTSPE